MARITSTNTNSIETTGYVKWNNFITNEFQRSQFQKTQLEDDSKAYIFGGDYTNSLYFYGTLFHSIVFDRVLSRQEKEAVFEWAQKYFTFNSRQMEVYAPLQTTSQNQLYDKSKNGTEYNVLYEKDNLENQYAVFDFSKESHIQFPEFQYNNSFSFNFLFFTEVLMNNQENYLVSTPDFDVYIATGGGTGSANMTTFNFKMKYGINRSATVTTSTTLTSISTWTDGQPKWVTFSLTATAKATALTSEKTVTINISYDSTTATITTDFTIDTTSEKNIILGRRNTIDFSNFNYFYGGIKDFKFKNYT